MGGIKSKERQRYDTIVLFRELSNFYQFQNVIIGDKQSEEFLKIQNAIVEIKGFHILSQDERDENKMREGYRLMKKHYKKTKTTKSFIRYESACLTWKIT